MVRSAVREVRLGKMLGKAAEVAAPRTTARAGTRRAATGPSGRASEITVWALALLLILFLAIPVGALVIRALGTGTAWDARTYDTLRRALRLSLATTALSMVIVIALGTPLAFLLARRRFPGAAAVEALVDLPIVLPPAVAGIAMLAAFGRQGLVGQWLAEGGITVGFTTIAVVMAQVFVSAPFCVIAARGGFARVDSDLEAAAADLGATPGQGLSDRDVAAHRPQPRRWRGPRLGAGPRRIRGHHPVCRQFSRSDPNHAAGDLRPVWRGRHVDGAAPVRRSALCVTHGATGVSVSLEGVCGARVDPRSAGGPK